ncbi:phospholipid-transporting ATPase ABCA3-like isoform X2 [Dermacentor albipictus]|uniref:phospholipid-transporting ATPase ABCA3-like isoform X2 n=1 Tax=Dermacentor albipictus TaxID=60249 RepID=UPI0038FCD393
MQRFLVQARLVLWHRVAIHMLRRHWCASILELLATVACFTQVGRTAPRPSELGNFTTARLFPARFAFPNEWPVAVVYEPPSAYAEDLLSSYRKRTEIFEYLNVRSPVRAVRSEQELRAVCRGQVREAYERDYVLCVSFHGRAPSDGIKPNGSSGFPSLNYTLHMFAGGLPKVGFKEPVEFGDQEPTYLEKLIQKAQVWIDTEHLTLVDRNARIKKEWYTVYTRQFPQTALPLDIRGYREKVLLFLALSYSVPFCLRISSAVSEASSGLRFVVQHAGLLETAYWFGHLAIGVLMGAASGAAVLLLMMSSGGEYLPYLSPQALDAGPLILTFLLFSCLFTMHSLFVASLFRTASIAITFAVIYWFPVMLFLPWQVIEGYESPLGSYLYAPRHLKLISSVTPCLGTYWILKIVGISLDYKGSATWSLVNTNVLSMDNITIAEVWAVMAGTSLALAILVLYSNLLQSRLRALATLTGSLVQARRPHRGLHHTGVPIEIAQEPFPVESQPQNLQRMVSVLNVTKGFGSTTSLYHVSVDVYKGQITVLLGHNGAGKTTLMNVIAGTLQPDSGKVVIDGVDTTQFPERARQIVSFCQQKSVFFPDLTVWEHLVFYATVKESRPALISKRISHALKQARLLDKKDCLCGTLSGGQKQRLSVAIATVSRPKVVILDEPSSSLDPESRRELWDVLLAMRRRQATVLLSTHDMHEADVLADRVVLLCRGSVCCAGSPIFLKKHFSTGCHVTITKLDDTFRVDQALSEVRQIVPEAIVREDRMHEVSLTLHQCNTQRVARVLRLLEQRSKDLGVAAVGLKATTLEDIYISVYNNAASEDSRDCQLTTGGGYRLEMRPLSRASTATNGSAQSASTASRLAALWSKRWRCFARSPSTPFVCWLLPAAVFFVQFRLEQDLLTRRNPLTARLGLVARHVDTELIAVTPKDLYPHGTSFVQVDNVSVKFVQQYFGPVAQASMDNVVSVASAQHALLAIGFANFLEYTRAFVFGSVFRQDDEASSNSLRLEAWWNPHAVLSGVIALNTMHTTLLRHLSGDATAGITMSVRLYKEEESNVGPMLDFSKAAKRDALSVVLPMFVRAVFIPLGTALCIAPMALQPSAERVAGVLAIQLMAGVSPLLFWAANLAFDLCLYALAWSLVGALINAQYDLAAETNGALAVVLSFSVVGICTAYLVASFSKSPTAAFTFTALFFFFGGAAPIFVYLVVTALNMSRGIEAPRWAPQYLCPLPAFAFPWALVKLLQLDAENAQCERYARTKHGGFYQLDVFCLALASNNRFPGAMHFCCEHYANNATVGVKTLDPFSFHQAGVALEILVMAAEGALLFALVVWRDARPTARGRLLTPLRGSFGAYKRWHTDDTEKIEAELDADVRAERELVQRELQTGVDPARNAVIVDNVQKRYGRVHAVRGVSLAVRPGECVGLLGANGAGKSTTFRMLAAVTRPSEGDAYMSQAVLSRNPRQWQSAIGYCPQTDGLLDNLTAREYLRLIARLRGVPEGEISPLLDYLLYTFRLSGHAGRRCGTYSGGNRRKLSVAAALIGQPRVVFLDEPSAGVDVMARRDILAALRAISATCGTAVVMTSHKMEECEAACDRVGIMAEGQFRCLGPLRRIMERYGRGCTLAFTVNDAERGHSARIDSAVNEILPKSKRLRVYKGRHEYQLDKSLSWGTIYTKIEELKVALQLDDIWLSPTTLEDVFTEFATVGKGSA